jgi:hypothetical protein
VLGIAQVRGKSPLLLGELHMPQVPAVAARGACAR